jgi:hemerythrin-like domain-containing protein
MNRHAAVAAIEGEHRSLSAVIHGLQYLAAEIRSGRSPPDRVLLGAMLRYVREYPDRLHHPAEDRTLFALLRRRTHDADSLIAELEAEHAQGEARLAALELAVDRLVAGAPGAAEAFETEVIGYAAFHWEHMRKEEEGILPVAQRVLEDEDWGAVAAAFGAQAAGFDDGDTAQEFRRLFSRIVALAPPPIGVGADRGSVR